MKKLIPIIAFALFVFSATGLAFAGVEFQSVSTTDAVFVLFGGKVHLIPATGITAADYKNSENFASWLESHKAKKLHPMRGKTFTKILAKAKKLGIVVNDKVTLLYDFTVEYGEVVLSGKKVFRQVIKKL
jgi:hypothetical protein